MNSDLDEIKININEFQNIFKQFYEHFFAFYLAKEERNSIYSIAHPELEEDLIKLQVCFIKLPEKLQKRLLEIDFEIFIHCNNDIDLYSFREYLYKKEKFHTILTLTVRINTELRLALHIVNSEAWDRYGILPKRNLNFYREEKDVSILEENNNLEKDKVDINRIEKEDINVRERSQRAKDVNNSWIDRIDNIDDSSSKSIINEYKEFLGTSNDTIEETKKFAENISPLLKIILKLISI